MRINMRQLMKMPGVESALRDSVMKPVDHMHFTLHWPVSANKNWKPARNRIILSKESKQYRKEVVAIMLKNGMRMTTGRYAVTIWAHPPDHRRRDLDNLQKCLLDSLVKAGVIEDDELIDDLRILRRPVEKPGHVVVAIETIQEGLG